MTDQTAAHMAADPQLPKVDRVTAFLRQAIEDRHPLTEDWWTAADDAVTDLEQAIHEARHPDNRNRAVGALASLAKMWLDSDDFDALWLAGGDL